MDRKSLLFSSFFIALIFIFSMTPSAISHEVDDEREFTYDIKSANGPNNWGKIHPEWRMCSEGDMQSPIDLTNQVEITPQLGRLDRNYVPSNATLLNRGHDMMLKWIKGAGILRINGTEYQLNQLHWHTPSEHTINGRRFDLELHLVHENSNGGIAVFGILYKIGAPDSLLSLLEPHLKELAAAKGVEKSVGIINPKELQIGINEQYYRYMGSLTTPPCSQNVVWTLASKVRTVSQAQMHLIREAVHDDAEVNSRPTQPMNNRPLKFYRSDNGENI